MIYLTYIQTIYVRIKKCEPDVRIYSTHKRVTPTGDGDPLVTTPTLSHSHTLSTEPKTSEDDLPMNTLISSGVLSECTV